MKKFKIGDSLNFKDGRTGIVEDYTTNYYIIRDNHGNLCKLKKDANEADNLSNLNLKNVSDVFKLLELAVQEAENSSEDTRVREFLNNLPNAKDDFALRYNFKINPNFEYEISLDSDIAIDTINDYYSDYEDVMLDGSDYEYKGDNLTGVFYNKFKDILAEGAKYDLNDAFADEAYEVAEEEANDYEPEYEIDQNR